MMVGRDRELAELQRLVADGRPVVVLGEAGVGKTAVVREAAARGGNALMEAGALATLSWHPYLPFRRLLGRAPAGDAARVAAEVERAVGDAQLFLDDLHWADRETRAAIPHLVGRVRLIAALRRGDPAFGATLAELDAAGFARLPLEPLEHDDAVALVARLRPGVVPEVAAALAARSGGNPLLIEELSATGEASVSLRFAMVARLRHLSPAARRAMGMLSLAGRPLPAGVLGPGGAELVASGLARRCGGDLAVRHALLAETAAAALGDSARRDLSLALSAHSTDPGERARHLAVAGARPEAHRLAMEAAALASTPGERALHLEVAARCAAGPGADATRVAAAEALAEADLCERAAQLLDLVREPDMTVAARRHLYRSRVALAGTDIERAHDECARGLELVAATGTEVEAELALHDAQIAQTQALLFDLDPGVAERRAARALELSMSSPRLEAHARWLVGSAGLRARAAGWPDEFRRALGRAREIDAGDLEFRIAEALLFALLVSGDIDEGLRIADSARARAAERGLTTWERRLRTGLVGLHWHGGDLAAALRDCGSLVAESGPRGRLGVWTSQVLADVGRHGESVAIARRLVAEAHPTWQSLGEALWALGDAELAAGDPRRSLAAAEDLRDRFGRQGPAVFARVTRAWARHDLGLEPDGEPIVAGQPIVAGAPAEVRGVALLTRGDPRGAAACFAEAAALWRARHFRGHLRSRWAHGEALRRSGDPTAVAALEAAEAIAIDHGEAAMLRRIRRSLRLTGARRSVVRGPAGEVTPREREILGLVADGLSNGAIARRLGIGRPTVEHMLKSAARKLGARTRAQAAALLDRE